MKKSTAINFKSMDEMSEFIIKESRRHAKNYSFKHKSVNASDMEGWLIEEVFTEVKDKPHMQNNRGICHILFVRTNDYIREISRHNDVMSYEGLVDDSQKESDSTFGDAGIIEASVDPIEEYVQQVDVFSFLKSLHIDEKRTVELTAGMTRSLSRNQIDRVKELIDKKAICNCGLDGCQHNVNVWFTATEVGGVLGLTRRQVQYILSKMKEKALEFGLEC